MCQPDKHDVFCFATIQSDTGLDRKRVRQACRSLTDKGLARYERSTWDDDGAPAGSGYWATDQARRTLTIGVSK